jgi:hypothetical protein
MYAPQKPEAVHHAPKIRRRKSRYPLAATSLMGLFLIASVNWSTRSFADFSQHQSTRRFASTPFNCGYDPEGAADGWLAHKSNLFSRSKANGSISSKSILSGAGPTITDVGDIAVIEDDGTVIYSPNRFNLKNSSILFTPGGDGYRISTADIGFTKDVGGRLGFFFGVDKRPEDGDNGYRDFQLPEAQFPFYGTYYDTIYIGTNGYITFNNGDTTARLSPAALASDLPRIAPLWADLEVVDAGEIYYKRFADRHLITWSGVGQPAYEGLSTFQVVLYDDGRIGFSYRKVKAQAALVGISPGGFDGEPRPIDFSRPPADPISGPVYQMFGKQKRLDLPALLRAFYSHFPDDFDTTFIWSDFEYDNGLGVAHSFNIRNQISGIGLRNFDRGFVYGSPERLSTIVTMGNQADWPANPQVIAAGLNSAISIVCHEQGHRWLAYVRFDAEHDIKDDLLGRENAHWSFLVDTRTNAQGSFSSLMEGNAWRDSGSGSFTTIETSVNYFTPLDQYLMGLRSPDDVGDIPYLTTSSQLEEFLRAKSPASGFSLSAIRKTTSVAQIVEREGPRIPDVQHSQKDFRVAFILLTERGAAPSSSVLDKIATYRDAFVEYFSTATEKRATMSASLQVP